MWVLFHVFSFVPLVWEIAVALYTARSWWCAYIDEDSNIINEDSNIIKCGYRVHGYRLFIGWVLIGWGFGESIINCWHHSALLLYLQQKSYLYLLDLDEWVSISRIVLLHPQISLLLASDHLPHCHNRQTGAPLHRLRQRCNRIII